MVNTDREFMDDVAYVMLKTSNTYFDIMKMPYVVFLSMVKHIRISELMQNDEWREAYFKYKYQEAYKNNKIVKQTKTDLKGLMSLQSKI